MMSSIPNRLHAAVVAALGELAAEVTEDQFGRWRIRCDDGFQLTATLEDEWVALRTSFAKAHIHGEAILRCAYDIVSRNSELPGAAKLVMSPDHAVVYAATEIPLERTTLTAASARDESETPMAGKLRRAIDDLARSARSHLKSKDPGANHSAAAESPDLMALCAAAGWSANPRSEHRVSVQLEVPHGYAQAILAWDQGLHAAVSLARIEESLSASSRQAVAVMLLQLGGAVRGVRPAIDRESGQDVLTLQSYLPPQPCAREVDYILSGLSVAAGMCRHEIAFLFDESISKRYLSARMFRDGLSVG
jgi:hypothetical protein